MSTIEPSPTEQAVPRSPREDYEQKRMTLDHMQRDYKEAANGAYDRAAAAASRRNRRGLVTAMAAGAVVGLYLVPSDVVFFFGEIAPVAATFSCGWNAADAEGVRRREIKAGDRAVVLGRAAGARSVLNAVQIGDCTGLSSETMTALQDDSRPLLYDVGVFSVDELAGVYVEPTPTPAAS